MLDAVVKVLRLANLRNDFQVADALANCRTELMGVNDSREKSSGVLAHFRLGREVFVSRKQRAIQSSSSVEEFVVREFSGAILLGGFDVDSSPQQSSEMGPGT